MKKIFITLLSLLFLFFVVYPLSNFNSFKSKISPLIPNNFKQQIKAAVIGKEKLKIMEELYNTREIKNNYNQKDLPITEYLTLDYSKLSLKKFDLTSQPPDDNKMFVKPETTSFYFDYIDNQIIILSLTGKFIFLDSSKLKNKILKQTIKPKVNFDDNFSKVLDVMTHNERIYFSFAKKIKENCFYLGIKSADYNNNELNFNTIFLNEECVESIYAGRMLNYRFNDKDGFLISIDALAKKKDYAQKSSSNLGKILFLDYKNLKPIIFSKGHRNPQGLYNDNGIIISTEHGPRGGDEINIINYKKNYGWPISSYGEPYKYEDQEIDSYKYLKDHESNNFQEPIYSFIPSIGISQLTKVPGRFSNFWRDNYLISSLNGGSVFRLKLDLKKNKLIYSEKIFFNERIRDIGYIEQLNVVILALENTGSLGILSAMSNQ